MANTGTGAGPGTGGPSPTPDPNTGDILAALQNEQATLATVANFGRECSTTLVSMMRDQRALLNEVKKQSALLGDIREILNKFSGNQFQFNTQQTRLQQQDRQSTMTQRMRVNNTLSDVLGRIDKQHRQESKILHVLENRAKDLNRSVLQNIILDEASRFEEMLTHLYDSVQSYSFGDDFQAVMNYATDENRQQMEDLQKAFRQEINNLRLGDSNLENELKNLSDSGLKLLSEIHKADVATNSALANFDSLDDAEFAKLQSQLQDIQDTFEEQINSIYQDQQKQEIVDSSGVDEQFDVMAKGAEILNKLDSVLHGPGMGEGKDLSAIFTNSAGPLGDLASDALKDVGGEIFGNLGEAAGTALGGPAGAAIGKVVGKVVGEALANNVGKAIERAQKALGEVLEAVTYQNRKTRDEAIKLSFEKIRQDAKTMATYQIDIIESATQKIYDAWDNNLSKVNATMNYTKAQLNTLQDSVAQKLIDEGYGNVIDASKYLDELSKTLDANLNSKLASEFATQALILEKAIPEFDATSMAKEFAAIYTQAQKQGEDGTTAMIRAMEQVAGATKAIEEGTDGNNQFITKIGEYLQKSTSIVNMVGGSVDQIADLTTQMMAAEGPIGSLTPQLTGFTGELVDILTNKNDSTALALRAIMHDMNSEIGISQTEFRESFINDTQGTLETAFRALEQFIDRNSSDGARFEFLDAMSEIFGVSTEKLAQIDFGYVADQLSKTNEALNKSALVEAEQLLKDGETTTLEEQLVANTANQLLATNQVRDTLDNKVMRELEKHELELERQVLYLSSTQSVDLAEKTMGFLYKLKDIFVDLLDPLGIFKAVSSGISAVDSWNDNQANYEEYQSLSSVTSALEDTAAANERTARLTTEGAHAIYAVTSNVNWTLDQSQALKDVVAAHGISNSNMVADYKAGQETQRQSSEAAIEQYASVGSKSLDIQQQALEIQEAEAQKEEEYRQARIKAQEESLKREETSYQMSVDNHANLERMAGDSGVSIDSMNLVAAKIADLQSTLSDESIAIQTHQAAIEQTLSDFYTAYSTESMAIQTHQASIEQTLSDFYTSSSAENAAIQTNQTAMAESLSQFHTTYSESISSLETNMRDKTAEHVSTLVTAINNSKPDVSSLRDIKEGVDRVITLFSTYLEVLDSAMVQSTGEGLKMAASDRQQILGRGLLR